MLSSALNNRVGNTMALIAVSQMLMDKLDSLIKVNRYDVSSIGITSSLGLTINLAQMVGMSFDEIVDLVTDFLTRNYGTTIKTLDTIVRGAILAALDGMVSCAASPIISDDLMYHTDGNGNLQRAVSPMVINLGSVDIYNLFAKATPTGDRAEYYYGDVPSGITPSMTWKSGDLDAFIWYVINMVEPASSGDRKYTYKLSWDNRNSFFKNDLDNEDYAQYPEGDMVTYIGDTALDFWSGVEEGEASGLSNNRKMLFRLDYNDRTNSLLVQFDGETYGKRVVIGPDYPTNEEEEEQEGNVFRYERNATIYEFNKDYVENLRIFYVKPIVTAILNAATNLSIDVTFSGTLSLEEEITRGEISRILTKVIEADDTEIEDCYFTFSNDEYDDLVHEAEMRRKGIKVKRGDTNIGVTTDTSGIIEALEQMTGTATLQEQKTIIKNTFETIASVTGATDDVIDTKWNWDGDTYATNILQLLRAILMQLLEALLTPRVVLIFLINYKFANGELPKSPLDFLSAFLKLLWPVIKALVDYFIEFLFGEVIQRVKELMEIYLLKLALEQLQKYKDILLALIQNCTLNISIPYFKKTQMIGNIDNVVGADILEMKGSPDKDNC